MTPDEIFLPAPRGRQPVHTIFFITGNPGLIAYYTQFLSTIYESINAEHPDDGVAVYGRSLGGFEVEPKNGKPRIYSLQEQIDYVQAGIDSLVDRTAVSGGNGKVQLTLAGHSVGTWIILRLLEKYYAARKTTALRYEIEAGILLFPTVVNLAKSPSGTRVGWPLSVPLWPAVGGKLVCASTRICPARVLRVLVSQLPAFRGAVRGSEKDQAVDTCIAFLQSSTGVAQCLTMAADEMREIAQDRFSQEIWGSTAPEAIEMTARPSLFFYFGSQDHWVANETRDALINARAFSSSGALVDRLDWRKDSRPWMEIDKHDTDHSFCIQDSTVVAAKVVEYMGVVLAKPTKES